MASYEYIGKCNINRLETVLHSRLRMVLKRSYLYRRMRIPHIWKSRGLIYLSSFIRALLSVAIKTYLLWHMESRALSTWQIFTFCVKIDRQLPCEWAAIQLTAEWCNVAAVGLQESWIKMGMSCLPLHLIRSALILKLLHIKVAALFFKEFYVSRYHVMSGAV